MPGGASGARFDQPDHGLPIAVIGAGPVGLVAAAHLLSRGITPVVFELGEEVGWSIRKWGHVRLFSPWRYLIDDVAAALLEEQGWVRPEPAQIPTGRELVERFLEPLGKALSQFILTNACVTDVARSELDLMKTTGRDEAPFEVRYRRGNGHVVSVLVRAVIDASGTYYNPNPLGANGLHARGEELHQQHLHYGVPNVLGADRQQFVGRHTAVVGSGHTAFNALLALQALRQESPNTRTTWVVRGDLVAALSGGGEADALAERGKLGLAVRDAIASGQIGTVDQFRVHALERDGSRVMLASMDGRMVGPLDNVVVATGYRPDLDLTRELRLDLDPSVEAPRNLAPMIDPNVHSCGTVPPHGFMELSHPERNFFTVGMKSYGRAPTFLLLTGYEQVRSVSAFLAGDDDSARAVMLDLPETGVCVTDHIPEILNGPEVSGEASGPSPHEPVHPAHASDVAS